LEQLFKNATESNPSTLDSISSMNVSTQEDGAKELDNKSKSQDVIDDDSNDLIIEGKRSRRPFRDMMPMFFREVCCSAGME